MINSKQDTGNVKSLLYLNKQKSLVIGNTHVKCKLPIAHIIDFTN
jgi:hypothetical protein